MEVVIIKNSYFKKNPLKVLMFTILITLFTLLIFPMLLSLIIYESIFSIRFNDENKIILNENIEEHHYSFLSNKGQKLNGFMYSLGNENKKGLIVLVHGYGSSHLAYLDLCEYFATKGYYVFSYDGTGYNNSEGKDVGGLVQSVIDLDYAIDFIKTLDIIDGIPLYLLGHSCGAYAVGTVLNYHPEVEGVCFVSGFNESSDLLESYASKYIGFITKLTLPYVKLYERIKFGTYQTKDVLSGFENSDCDVLIIHSVDDEKVSIDFGLNRYFDLYKSNDRFSFIRLNDKGHSSVFYDENFSLDYKLLEEILIFFS